MPIRSNFPLVNEDYLGGHSDGWEYTTSFSGKNWDESYKLVSQFLVEEGYSDVPIPQNAAQLLLFRNKNIGKQIRLFEEKGYIHNPIKILFPEQAKLKNTLILKIYNENHADHLLKFHKII